MADKPEFERITLRIPRDLHQMLVAAARGASPPRSLNQEILQRLYRSFIDEPPEVMDDGRSLGEVLDHMMVQIRELEALVRSKRPRGD